MTIKTSYFGKRLPASAGRPVGIARFLPSWYAGEVYMPLAPEAAWLRLRRDEFTAKYREKLAGLDVKTVGKALEGAVLLCYETLKADDDWCHRQIVAEWLREAGFTVEEA